jgi:hypothetical protein
LLQGRADPKTRKETSDLVPDETPDLAVVDSLGTYHPGRILYQLRLLTP